MKGLKRGFPAKLHYVHGAKYMFAYLQKKGVLLQMGTGGWGVGGVEGGV